MKERPGLFSAPMVRAILEDRKTKTRRVVKHPASRHWTDGRHMLQNKPGFVAADGGQGGQEGCWIKCPYGQPGDRLWVRETWQPFCAGPISEEFPMGTCVKYAADGALVKPSTWSDEQGHWCETHEEDNRWRPSIFMPRWASRLTLEIVSIQVERLQDISEEDARAEGVEYVPACDAWNDYIDPDNVLPSAVQSFASLWSSINGHESWDANPWVWVIEFRRITP